MNSSTCGKPTGEFPNGCAPVQALITTVALHSQEISKIDSTVKDIHSFAWKFGGILTMILTLVQTLVTYLLRP